MIHTVQLLVDGASAACFCIALFLAEDPWDDLAYTAGLATLAVDCALNKPPHDEWAGFFAVLAVGMLIRTVNGFWYDRQLAARKRLKKIKARRETPTEELEDTL